VANTRRLHHELFQSLAQDLLVLRDAVLDVAGAVARRAKVTVGAFDHVCPSMPYLPRHRPRADGLPAIERLKAGGDVGVAERLGANLRGLVLVACRTGPQLLAGVITLLSQYLLQRAERREIARRVARGMFAVMFAGPSWTWRDFGVLEGIA
jgi:hypothetical protein